MRNRGVSVKCLFIFLITTILFLTLWFALNIYKMAPKSTKRHSTPEMKPPNPSIWERSQILDSHGRIQIQWNFTKEDITMMVTAATTGYVGVGFSLTRSMADADIIIGWVQENKAHLQDFHGTGNSQPILDSQQDLELLLGKENGTHTVLCFRRKLNTCDKQDIVITTTTLYAIWFMNDTDPEHVSDVEYHKRKRDSVPIHLLDIKQPIPALEDVEYFDVGANRTKNVFKWKTFYYWCQYVKIPDFGEKHHLIGYVPMIQPGHEDAVHHILLYECAGFDLEKYLSNDEGGHMCWSPWQFYRETSCRRELVSWTIGSKGEFYPPHIGYPFGSTKDKPHYILMQVHYSYKNYRQNFEDSSKLRLYHTKQLRANDASTFNVAARQFQIIPAKQPEFSTIGICSPTCTQSFPPTGIHLFRYLFHGHKAVRKIRLRHFRDGIEINSVFDENFHFEFQEGRYFKEEIVVLPNDWLAVDCVHDTMDRNLTTMSGMDSEEEMCIMIIQYYPPMDISVCYSALHPNDVQKVTDYYHFSQNDTVELLTNPYLYVTHFFFMTLYMRYLPLNQEQAVALQKLYLEGDQIPLCLNDTLLVEYYTNELISYSKGKLADQEQCRFNALS